MAEVQDYLDLDAAGFLLVALGHLVKAKEKLYQEPRSRTAYWAMRWTTYATNFVRRALELLAEQKEETCKEPMSWSAMNGIVEKQEKEETCEKP